MKRSYDSELGELASTYSTTRQLQPTDDLVAAVVVHQPTIFVGSGGALAVAQLAADLHVHYTGYLGVAMTPLEAATAQTLPDTGVVLFSSRGKNPDATLVISAARRRGATHLGVVTCRERHELPAALGADDVKVGSISAPPDGFLATNSLLAMATAVCSAYGAALPLALPALGLRPLDEITHSCIAVTGPGTKAVAVDLEARLVETGLANVQLADFRNLAHGRHVGIGRNATTTTVIAVVDGRSEDLARRSLDLFPDSIRTIELRTSCVWPASVLDLLVQSMQLASLAGHETGMDPGGPGVPKWGRSLYHLPARKLVRTSGVEPVERKTLRRPPNGRCRSLMEAALTAWLDELASTRIGGIVLDYDGTCCTTVGRFEPPSREVQTQIIRLLEAGLVVGFATGRGKSLHNDTRAWLPERYWSDVHVGLYNGTNLLTLAEDPPKVNEIDASLVNVASQIEAIADVHGLQIRQRPGQISVTGSQDDIAGRTMLPAIQAVLERSSQPDVKVVASGHSVDIIKIGSGKVQVVERVSAAHDAGTLVIGDQGQFGGNDFEMLAATTSSLSVDLVSHDPTRCWNLDQRGERGPDLLVRYLKSLQKRKDGARFLWKGT